MDGACDIFWIKSINGTFIALQIKSFSPIQARVKKCFDNFSERDGMAVPC